MYKNKKATIGATMTWVVATIIVLFVIIIFVYASGVLAGKKGALDFKPSVQIAKYSSVESEQMLLALLRTEINGKTVKDYILEGDYDGLEKSEFREKVLTELPEPRRLPDGWHLYIYENNDVVKKIKSLKGTLSVAESLASEIYLNLNKKVKLFLNAPL